MADSPEFDTLEPIAPAQDSPDSQSGQPPAYFYAGADYGVPDSPSGGVTYMGSQAGGPPPAPTKGFTYMGPSTDQLPAYLFNENLRPQQPTAQTPQQGNVPDFKSLEPIQADTAQKPDKPSLLTKPPASINFPVTGNPMLDRQQFMDAGVQFQPEEGLGSEAIGVGSEGLKGIGDLARAGVSDVAAGLSLLKKPENLPNTLLPSPSNISRTIQQNMPQAAAASGNIPAALKGQPLPIDETLKQAAEQAQSEGRFPTEATIGKLSEDLAATAPLAAIGALPAAAQKVIMAGFTAKMISDAPKIATALGEELGKPKDQQDPDRISSLVSDAIQTTGFSIAGALGTMHGLRGGARDTGKFQVEPREFKPNVTDIETWIERNPNAGSGDITEAFPGRISRPEAAEMRKRVLNIDPKEIAQPEEAAKEPAKNEEAAPLKVGEKLPREETDSEGFTHATAAQKYADSLPVGSVVKRFMDEEPFEKQPDGTWRQIKKGASDFAFRETIKGGNLHRGEIVRIGNSKEAEKGPLALKQEDAAKGLPLSSDGTGQGKWNFTITEEGPSKGASFIVPEGSTPEVIKAKMEAIKKPFEPETAKPGEAKSDYDRYKELTASLKGKSLNEAAPIAKEIEAIKNRNAGKPPKAPLPTADKLIGMTPEEVTTWKKDALYGPETSKSIAETLKPEDVEKLKTQREKLGSQSRKIIEDAGKLPAGPERDAAINKASPLWNKGQILSEIIQDYGAKAKAEVPKEDMTAKADVQKQIAQLQTQRAEAISRFTSPGEQLKAAAPFNEKIAALQKGEAATPAPAAQPAQTETATKLAMEGMGGARAGEIPKEPSRLSEVKSLFGEPLKKARNTIVQLAKSGKVRDTLAYTRDAGENAANNFAKQQANEPRNAIRRLFPKPADQKMASDALSFIVEAKGNPDALTEMRQKVMDSQAASPKWKKKAFDAIDFAIYNYDKLKPVADRYSEITGQQVADENGAGIDTLKRDGYVMHAQDIDDMKSGFLSEGVGGEASAFKKVRTHDTFADSIAAGVDPKSLNATDLLESRLAHGQKMINSRSWIKGLSDMTDPTTGKSIAAEPKIVTRADGSTYQQAPEGYTLERAGFQPVAIHKGYEGIFGALTDPSWFQKNAGARNFMKANAVGKSINLMIDTFHLGRLSFWESLIKGLGVETFKAPVPSYRKGLTLIDNTPEEIRTMAKNGEIPASWMPEMLENKRRLDLAVKSGYNIGKITDNLHNEWIRDVPVAGQVNKFIFDKFQRGAMSEIWLLEFERIKKALPDLPEGEAARRVSKDLNTRFGSLGRQGIFKSRTAQDAAKLLGLAPQWNEGLIRSELGAVKQAGELAVDAAKGRQIYSGVLLRSVGAMALGQFAANQLINLYTRGKPTWENPEEGIGAKLSAWIPDKVGGGPGFFIHPLGLAAETTHLIMQKYEKTGDFRKTLNQYLRTRSSAAMRPILTFITNQDALGRNLKPGSVWGEIVKSAIPTPIGGSAITQAAKQVISGEPSESFPGQYQKQAMASGGIKTDQAPSARQRIQSLASEFKRSKGITPSGEFYTGDYQPLSQAAEIGNRKNAKEAVADLLKKKTSSEIQKHYQSAWKYPFTGSKKREAEFFQTLNPEQQDTYKKAIEERKQSAMKAMQAMRDYFATKGQQ